MKPIFFFLFLVLALCRDSIAQTGISNNNIFIEKAKEVNIELIWVEGGTFEMGNKTGESDERTVHAVSLSGFYIGKTEVTQAQWRKVMGKNPSYFSGCDECPVESVSWKDVQAFITKLNKLTGKSYRLPTEAEWEYAAKGGQKSRGYTYSGGNNIDSLAWHSSNSNQKTNPVGGLIANELGLFDMTGNVWEWCNDWYSENYYSASPKNAPQGPDKGTHRVLRGASWFTPTDYCRVTDRTNDPPVNANADYGFRLVL